MEKWSDPDGSLMFILVLLLFLRSCSGCETKELEEKMDRLNDKIDSLNIMKK